MTQRTTTHNYNWPDHIDLKVEPNYGRLIREGHLGSPGAIVIEKKIGYELRGNC
jgi:hypothetical protein